MIPAIRLKCRRGERGGFTLILFVRRTKLRFRWRPYMEPKVLFGVYQGDDNGESTRGLIPRWPFIVNNGDYLSARKESRPV